MVTTLLSHEVKNYSDWKKGFDADAANRAGMGVTVKGVFQNVDNPNMVAVITEVQSMEAIQAFLGNPELGAAMEAAGVVGKPSFQILNDM